MKDARKLKGMSTWRWQTLRYGRRTRISAGGITVLVETAWKHVDGTESSYRYFPVSTAFNEPRNV